MYELPYVFIAREKLLPLLSIMHITYIHIKYVERYVWTHVSSDFVLKRINK